MATTNEKTDKTEKADKAVKTDKADKTGVEKSDPVQNAGPVEKSEPDAADTPLQRPAVLWKAMTETQRHDAAHAFWSDRESMMEQAEVLALMARRLNFRFKSVQALPIEKKVKHLMAMGNVSDAVAGRLLVTYHLTTQRPMMGAFLDALGIKHEDGLIGENEVNRPEPEALKAAADKLRAAYPPEQVDLYFSTLRLQDPETWGALQ